MSRKLTVPTPAGHGRDAAVARVPEAARRALRCPGSAAVPRRQPGEQPADRHVADHRRLHRRVLVLAAEPVRQQRRGRRVQRRERGDPLRGGARAGRSTSARRRHLQRRRRRGLRHRRRPVPRRTTRARTCTSPSSRRCSSTAGCCTSAATCCSCGCSATTSRRRSARSATRSSTWRAGWWRRWPTWPSTSTRPSRSWARPGRSPRSWARTSCCSPGPRCAPRSSCCCIFFVNLQARIVLGFWFLLQFFTDPNQGVAWAAHVGGFVFGVLVGLIVRALKRPEPPAQLYPPLGPATRGATTPGAAGAAGAGPASAPSAGTSDARSSAPRRRGPGSTGRSTGRVTPERTSALR